ncbi:uncharacterized protein LOC131927106 [Physella acuta]|uniref:uncharacterized protein LOC131927106 n=1 Tax=Physella acuta TaxID=109671 RepID=UPI0027DAE3D4|nr:uncharacterized protein LOC131927106 [Physella acuta]
MCYQCATSSSSNDCITDWGGLVNTSRGLAKHYAKNCTDTRKTFDRCVIESAEVGGKFILYNRDCHDGLNFTKIFEDPKFVNLPPNNESTCGQVNNYLVCYRFCKTDFCNGPQAPPLIVKNCTGDEENWETCGAKGVYSNSGFQLMGIISLLFIIIVLS